MNGLTNNLISYTKTAAQGVLELKSLSLSKIRKVFSLMGKNEKITLAVLAAAALISFFISARNFYYNHTSPAPTNGGSYSEGLLGQPTYINPLLAHAEPDLSLTKLIYSGLYKYDNNGQLVPDLAEGQPQISEDQKQYTIGLRHDATWHNGKPITADDVIFTVQTLQDPNFKSPLRPMWQSTTVEKLSDYSVRFTNKDISGPFVNNLTLPILPKNVWGKVDADNFLLSKNNLEAVGSGPYAIKEIKKLPSGKVEQISLTSYADHYSSKAKIDQLIFKFYDSEDDILNAFHSREIDGFGFVPLGSALYVDKTQDKAQVLSIPLPQYQVVFFNLNNKILTDQDVRSALSLATNKQQIISDVFKGNAQLPASPLLFDKQKAPTMPVLTDLNRAAGILDNAGWKIDSKTGLRSKKNVNFEITIATNDTLVNSKAADVLANQWRKLNIKVNLVVLPSKQLTDTLIKPRTFDVLLFPQKFGPDPDPFLFWHSSQVKDPGFNLTGYSDPAADKLIIEARTTTDKNIREAKYEQFSNLITAKIPVIFLDQTEYIYAVDNAVKNIGIKTLYDPSQRFYNIEDWYINQTRVWK